MHRLRLWSVDAWNLNAGYHEAAVYGELFVSSNDMQDCPESAVALSAVWDIWPASKQNVGLGSDPNPTFTETEAR